VVLIIETLNTAIEVLTDRIGLEHNTLSGLAKDLGSLAVTLSLLLWAVVRGGVLSRYWTEWI
jgi:diacylglycerol kinase (ATP)